MALNYEHNYIKYLCLFVAIFFTVGILYAYSNHLAFAKKDDKDNESKGQLIVKTKIHLDSISNIDKTKFFRITGFINGQEVKKDIPISQVDKNQKILTVDLKLEGKQT